MGILTDQTSFFFFFFAFLNSFFELVLVGKNLLFKNCKYRIIAKQIILIVFLPNLTPYILKYGAAKIILAYCCSQSHQLKHSFGNASPSFLPK